MQSQQIYHTNKLNKVSAEKPQSTVAVNNIAKLFLLVQKLYLHLKIHKTLYPF